MNCISFKSRVYPIATITALMVAINFLEMFIVLPIPLFKIGFANILPVYFIFQKEYKLAFIVNILRVLIVSLISGKLFSFLFILSFSGVLVSTLVMITLKVVLINRVSIISISALGSVCNNITQYILFLVILNGGFKMLISNIDNIFVLLVFFSIISGLIIGFLASRMDLFKFSFAK